MKLHTINQWSATTGFAIILIWLTTVTLAQTDLKEALENIANVRVSRSEIKKEMKSKLEQKKVRKRQPELIEDLEASGSDFQPVSKINITLSLSWFFLPSSLPSQSRMGVFWAKKTMNRQMLLHFALLFDGLVSQSGLCNCNSEHFLYANRLCIEPSMRCPGFPDFTLYFHPWSRPNRGKSLRLKW